LASYVLKRKEYYVDAKGTAEYLVGIPWKRKRGKNI